MANYITQETYDDFIEKEKTNQPANHICDVRCRLGGSKTFQVKGTTNKLTLTCVQIGGFFTGNYNYVLR
jgi:hypothetical protein